MENAVICVESENALTIAGQGSRGLIEAQAVAPQHTVRT
jgi:hypothetical protein